MDVIAIFDIMDTFKMLPADFVFVYDTHQMLFACTPFMGNMIWCTTLSRDIDRLPLCYLHQQNSPMKTESQFKWPNKANPRSQNFSLIPQKGSKINK